SCTGSPTTWSTCFVCCNFQSRGAQHRSKLCAPAYLRSALASEKPLVSSASTSPPAGRGTLCFATWLWLSTQPTPFLPSRIPPSLQVHGGSFHKNLFPPPAKPLRLSTQAPNALAKNRTMKN